MNKDQKKKRLLVIVSILLIAIMAGAPIIGFLVTILSGLF